ncbi:MAG: ribbon-helix-helix domain-containing protein [Alphaproteobacteria bacterium]|nr:ribbon-helix-helix domain-containing protein [Alphaproteobacteria bacterium]
MPSARRSPEPGLSSLVIGNVNVAGHRTSVRLEPTMWEALRDIAAERDMTVHDLVTEIDRDRTASGLTAAIRVYIVDYYRSAATHAVSSGADPLPPPLVPA